MIAEAIAFGNSSRAQKSTIDGILRSGGPLASHLVWSREMDGKTETVAPIRRMSQSITTKHTNNTKRMSLMATSCFGLDL